MRKNANVKTYTYWHTVAESVTVTSQLSTIVVFLSSFAWLQEGRVSSRTLLVSGCLITACGFAAYLMRQSQQLLSQQVLTQTLKSTLSFTTTLLLLSPILKTLTRDTSSDTIYAMTTLLFIANFLCHNYSSAASTHATNARTPK